MQVPQDVKCGFEAADDSDADSSSSSRCQHSDLQGLKDRIQQSIERLGGTVAPKLNWSAPKDATWLSPAGMRCYNADEVLMLLKASERCSHDLEVLAQLKGSDAGTSSAVLALRKWFHVKHDREFRCFVVNTRLVAISQRDPTQHSPAMLADRHRIGPAIEAFFAEHIAAAFPLTDCALPAMPLLSVYMCLSQAPCMNQLSNVFNISSQPCAVQSCCRGVC